VVPLRVVADDVLRSRRFWVLACGAGAVSSLLGLRGWLAIWQLSLVGDAAFVAGTLGAFALTARIPRGSWLGAAAAGLGLHWLVYAVSWSLTLATADDASTKNLVSGADPVSSLPFVFSMGWAGLLWCAAASPLLRRLAFAGEAAATTSPAPSPRP